MGLGQQDCTRNLNQPTGVGALVRSEGEAKIPRSCAAVLRCTTLCCSVWS